MIKTPAKSSLADDIAALGPWFHNLHLPNGTQTAPDRMAFIGHRLANDPTNWWAPNHACVEAMLRSAGLRVLERPGHEIYVCEPGEPREEMAWIEDEMRVATGRTTVPAHGNGG